MNVVINIPINTELSRLGTSVSSLFSCFRFFKALKLFMQNRGRNLQEISEDHQKTGKILRGLEGLFSVLRKSAYNFYAALITIKI